MEFSTRWAVILCMLLQVRPSVGGVPTETEVRLIGESMVVGHTTSRMDLIGTYDSGFGPGHQLVFSCANAFWKGSYSPQCLGDDLHPSTMMTCATNPGGTAITINWASGGVVTAGDSLSIQVYSGFAPLPGPELLQCTSVVHSVDGESTDVMPIGWSIAAPKISLVSPNMGVGAQPTSLTITFRMPHDAMVFNIVANKPVFTPGYTSGNQVLSFVYTPINGTALILDGWSSMSSTSTVITATNSYGAQLAGGNAVLTIKGGLLAALPNDQGAVTLRIREFATCEPYSCWFTNAGGFGTISAAVADTSAVVAGDPITYFGNRRVEFELPFHRLTTLLRMPDIELAAAPFKGSKDEQWIGRVVIKSSASNDTLLQVDVKNDLENFDRSALAYNALETMNVLFSPDMVRSAPPFEHEFKHADGTMAVFSKLGCSYLPDIPCNEAFIVIGRYGKIMINTASAKEWYGIAPEALTHSHFDFEVFDMIETETFNGLLPEFWGLKQISDENKLLIKNFDSMEFPTPMNLTSNSTPTRASVMSEEPVRVGTCSADTPCA
mmetsp:Transcript_22325/g.47565  ORF Transcript_22325/g.47565 Transcript_22325/m.47565 type:complete len:551 (-) Transcript_22325:94-1746(-)